MDDNYSMIDQLMEYDFWILLIIVSIVLLLIFRRARKTKKSVGRRLRDDTIEQKVEYTIRDCVSNDDIEFKIGTYQQNIENELLKSRKAILEAKEKGYIQASVTWTNRFQELNQVSYTLKKNLEYENARKLKNDKFHRYTSLHFRSHIIGRLAYEDYMASKRVRDEINELLLAIGKREMVVKANEKRELYTIKDTCVNTTKYLYERMIAIQNETGDLRDKIRDECGKRGREWYKKIMSNRK